MAQRSSRSATTKLPAIKYAPEQFEAEADDVQASVTNTLKSISAFDPTDSNAREAKKRAEEDVDDPEAEALKRRLYRYKYVRRIDDKLPTLEQLRERIQQQEEDEKEDSDLASPRS